MRFKMIMLAAAVSVTLPAVAQTAPATDAKPVPPKEKKICRRYAVTGSIVGTKMECHTKVDWTAIDAANARSVDDTLGNTRTPR
jgi:hypothetical protein